MKINKAEYIITAIGVILSLMAVYLINGYFNNKVYQKKTTISVTTSDIRLANKVESVEEQTTETSTTTSTTTMTTTTQKIVTTTSPVISLGEEVIFDGLTKTELIDKLNKNLYDTLADTGIYFANYAAETGLDPYLAISIVNLETGCKWGCSSLVKNNYNIGGLRGNGSWLKFSSLEEGIARFLDTLYNGYWALGLTTPEAMNPKYATSTEWAKKVNVYYETIRAS